MGRRERCNACSVHLVVRHIMQRDAHRQGTTPGTWSQHTGDFSSATCIVSDAVHPMCMQAEEKVLKLMIIRERRRVAAKQQHAGAGPAADEADLPFAPAVPAHHCGNVMQGAGACPTAVDPVVLAGDAHQAAIDDDAGHQAPAQSEADHDEEF